MLLPLLTQTVETVLDDIGGQDGMGQHFSETPLILSLVPTPLGRRRDHGQVQLGRQLYLPIQR